MSLENTRGAPVELARVTGREEVAGPFQESVELVVWSTALELRRGRILQALRGGRSAKAFSFRDIECISPSGTGGVTVVPKDGSGVGPARTLHGIAAVTALAAWWATLGRPDARLVGAPATFVGVMGMARSGIALGGPAGVVFVPTGWAGAVDDTLVRIPLQSLHGIQELPGNQVRLHGNYTGDLRLDGTVASVDGLAAWFARTFVGTVDHARAGGVIAEDIIWQLDEKEAWRAVMAVADTTVSLSVPNGEVEAVSVPAGQIERLRLTTTGPDPVLVCRLDGRVHTLRPQSGRSAGGSTASSVLTRLDGLLHKSRGETSSSTVDLFRWQRLAGSYTVARLFRGASAEGVLEEVELKVTPRGMRLRGKPRANALVADTFSPGTRIRVTLPKGRGWQHFSATVRSLSQDLGAGAVIDSATLLLTPVTEKLATAEGRRAFHRVSFVEAIPFPLQRVRLVDGDWFSADMIDLSAGGFAARVDRPIAVGDRYKVELPTREWCPPLEAEVVHTRADRGGEPSWLAGFRLLGITEKHRSLLQREVLRQERLQVARKRQVQARRAAASGAAMASASK
jgi:hypothetical protein